MRATVGGAPALPSRPGSTQRPFEQVPRPALEEGETTLTACNGETGDLADCNLTSATVPWAAGKAPWRFHWKTTLPNVHGARWQIASSPFGKPSEMSKGANILANGNAAAGSPTPPLSEMNFSIDFATFATAPNPEGSFPHQFFLRVIPLSAAGQPIGPPSNTLPVERTKAFNGTAPPANTTLRASNGRKASSGEFPVLYDQLSAFVDWKSDPRSWEFQWKTTQPNYKSVLYQVSSIPYAGGTNALHPAGLVNTGLAEGTPSAGKDQAVFTIDFGSFGLTPPPDKAPTTVANPNKSSTAVIAEASKNPSYAAALAQLGLPAFAKKLEKYRDSAAGGLPHFDHKPFPGGAGQFHADYFVRVLTLDAAHKLVGEPSNSVQVRFGDPLPPLEVEPVETSKIPAASFVDGILPDVKFISYTPRSLGDSCHVIITSFSAPDDAPPCLKDRMKSWEVGPGSLIDICGETANCPPEEESDLEKLWDGIKTVANAFSEAFDAVASLYNGLKAGIIDAAASTFCPSDPATVHDACKGGIEVAMDTGLAALGLPPSLPDTAELIHDGQDYLASYIAEQTGMPEDAAKDLVNKTAEAAETALSNIPSDPNSWYKPDPAFYGYHAANLILEVSYPVPAGQPKYPQTLPASLTTSERKGLFNMTSVPIPALSPGMTMRVPVRLTENYNSVALPTDAFQSQVEGRWAAAYEQMVQFKGAISSSSYNLPAGKLPLRKVFSLSQPGLQPYPAP